MHHECENNRICMTIARLAACPWSERHFYVHYRRLNANHLVWISAFQTSVKMVHRLGWILFLKANVGKFACKMFSKVNAIILMPTIQAFIPKCKQFQRCVCFSIGLCWCVRVCVWRWARHEFFNKGSLLESRVSNIKQRMESREKEINDKLPMETNECTWLFPSSIWC